MKYDAREPQPKKVLGAKSFSSATTSGGGQGKAIQQPFAVFDIDGTLYRWQLFHELVQELTLANVFPNNSFRDIDMAWNKWRGGKLSFHNYERIVVDTMLKYLPLVPVRTFEAACDKVVEQSGHKVHHYTLNLLKQLKAEGYQIIALSGSQQELLDRFCGRYDFDIAIGATYERSGGRFTGQINRPTIGKKAQLLKDLIKAKDFTMEGSLAIGDSDGDADILELVERPIAFNPSAGLYERAKQDGWSIVIERKNIAYRLEKQDDSLILAETTVY